jgi:hypothetical protein
MTEAWAVYYGDGSIIYSSDCDVFDLPGHNVQAVVHADSNVGSLIERGTDNYVWVGDDWRGVDNDGLMDYFGWYKGPQKVLKGRTLSNDEYRAIFARALNDPRLPQKSGFYEHERRPD